MAPAHILVIDDDLSIRRLLRSSLRERGYHVSVAASGEEGLDLAASDPVDVVILDLGLPDMDGGEVCRQLRSWNAAAGESTYRRRSLICGLGPPRLLLVDWIDDLQRQADRDQRASASLVENHYLTTMRLNHTFADR